MTFKMSTKTFVQVKALQKRGNKMVAKDGITQIDAVSKTFTDFLFWKKGSGETCLL